VGSTPTRFRQLLDDSTAFVGVEPRIGPPDHGFCSQFVPNFETPQSALPTRNRGTSGDGLLARGRTLGTRFVPSGESAEKSASAAPRAREDVPVESDFDRKGLYEETHFAIPAGRIPSRRSRGCQG
jgi:hypothetical protein